MMEVLLFSGEMIVLAMRRDTSVAIDVENAGLVVDGVLVWY